MYSCCCCSAQVAYAAILVLFLFFFMALVIKSGMSITGTARADGAFNAAVRTRRGTP